MRDEQSAKGPSFAELRPYKSERGAEPGTTGFPVYPDLVERLVQAKDQPDPDGIVPHALATCCAYSYAGFDQRADPGTIAMIMARLGLDENHVQVFEQRVDAMYIASAGYLIQDKDRR